MHVCTLVIEPGEAYAATGKTARDAKQNVLDVYLDSKGTAFFTAAYDDLYEVNFNADRFVVLLQQRGKNPHLIMATV